MKSNVRLHTGGCFKIRFDNKLNKYIHVWDSVRCLFRHLNNSIVAYLGLTVFLDIRMYLLPYISRNYSHRPTYLSLDVWVYIFIQFCAVASKRLIFSAPECVLAVQGRSGSSKVDDFGTNRKRVWDFLLVGHCNYGAVLHRFWDTATYWLKIAYFPTPLSFGALAPHVPFGILRWSYKREETRVRGLSSSVDRMIVAWVVLTQCQRVTDRRTDGRIYYS